jgi:MFS family permease
MTGASSPLVVLPIGAALVALAFAAHLFVRAGRRASWFLAVWGVALLMFAAASAALSLGVLDGWSSAEFRVYWLFGAVLNVPYLALGEVYLLARRPAIGHLALLVVLAATAWAAAEVRTADLNEEVLRTETFFTGREVLGEDAAARLVAMYYSYTGTAVLVLGILWSAMGMRGRPEARDRLYGVLWIALGALFVFGGSVFARQGSFAGFSVTLLAGVSVMYWGFLTTTRPPRRPTTYGPNERLA